MTLLGNLVNLATKSRFSRNENEETGVTLSRNLQSLHKQYMPKDDISHFSLDKKAKSNHLAKTLSTLGIIFIVIQLCLFTLVGYIVHPSIPTPNTDKFSDEQTKKSLDEIVEETVPLTKDWYQKRIAGATTSSPSSQNELNGKTDESFSPRNRTSSSCIDIFFDEVLNVINNTTSPSYARLVFANFGDQLQKSPIIRGVLSDLLTEPQDQFV